MRWIVTFCALLAALGLQPATTHADEMDGRWAEGKTASRIASDAELRQQAIARNDLFEVGRQKLSREEYQALYDNEPGSAPWRPALQAWFDCLTEAADAFADQPEPAQTVVDAAFESCGKYESELARVAPVAIDRDTFEKTKTEIMGPKVLARVLAVRAAADRSRGKNDQSPAVGYKSM